MDSQSGSGANLTSPSGSIEHGVVNHAVRLTFPFRAVTLRTRYNTEVCSTESLQLPPCFVDDASYTRLLYITSGVAHES